MDARRKARVVRLGPRGIRGFHTVLYGSGGGRMARGAADVEGARRFVLTRRAAHRVRAESSVAESVEALSRGTNHTDLHRASERFGARKRPAREFQRQRPGLVRGHGLFPFGSQWTGDAVRL